MLCGNSKNKGTTLSKLSQTEFPSPEFVFGSHRIRFDIKNEGWRFNKPASTTPIRKRKRPASRADLQLIEKLRVEILSQQDERINTEKKLKLIKLKNTALLNQLVQSRMDVTKKMMANQV
mmetsp:Transcript_10252/g.11144  ORF Transcript_10252/g.11144 Transcript_10252/m.11144 type:complete len:120 (-) Transcript_10252:460-819(-)